MIRSCLILAVVIGTLLSPNTAQGAVCFTEGKCTEKPLDTEPNLVKDCYIDITGNIPSDKPGTFFDITTCTVKPNVKAMGNPTTSGGLLPATERCGLEIEFDVVDYVDQGVICEPYRNFFGVDIRTCCRYWKPVVEFDENNGDCAEIRLGEVCPEQ